MKTKSNAIERVGRRAVMPGASRVTVEERGLSLRGLTILALGSSTVVLSVAAAVAVWKIATGIQWAIIILAVGYAVQMALLGMGMYHRHRKTGEAMLEEARGRARAQVEDAHARLIEARRGRWGER